MAGKQDLSLGVDIIVTYVYNDIISAINKLDINDNSVKQTIIDLIEDKKGENKLVPEKKTKKKSSTALKRTIKAENQCTGERKDGSRCMGPKCSKNLGLCWGHMSKAQREEYKNEKGTSASKPAASKKYTITT